KPLTDQEDLLKKTELENETTQEAKNLSPLEQAKAEKLAKLESEKLESEKEFTRLKEQEQARKAALKKKLATKNLGQGLATTLSGALKYQWTKFTLGTLYRNAPDRILGVKLPKALNEATAGAALKYHIKRALE
ncbi:DUF3519 domain-containing protein, partial [Helicobacter pylori]|uniref:DUF3519 domain-containing protein n=1 Tax=Helicobacter pylori TaxID=210 RepID=UPI001F0BD426